MIGTDEMPCGIFNYLPLHCFSVSTSFFLQAVVLGYLLPVNREKLDLLCGWVKSLELGNYGHGFEKQVVYFFSPGGRLAGFPFHLSYSKEDSLSQQFCC